RNVFLEAVPSGAASGPVTEFRLFAADESTRCDTANAPLRIDAVGDYNDHAHFWPRFSPGGSRVSYVDKPQDLAAFNYRIVTGGGKPVLAVINQIESLGDDLLVAGATGPTIGDGPYAPLEIYRMKPGACSIEKKIAAEPAGGAALDMALSPDGKTVIFTSTR